MYLDYDPGIGAAILEFGPLEAYQRLIASSDAQIRTPLLDNGREIVARRTAIHTGLAAHWVDLQRETYGYQRPFALVALGGTGRGEMTPCSDTDFALLFEEPTKGNEFLTGLLDKPSMAITSSGPSVSRSGPNRTTWSTCRPWKECS